MMYEKWKQIEDFPRYYVSNYGNIKSTIGKEKQLKQYINKKGYCYIKLSKKNTIKGQYIVKECRVHRLVAQYFCDNYDSSKDIHHINHIPTDNRASNLLCLTKAEHYILHKEKKEAAGNGCNKDRSELEKNNSK